MFFECIPDVQMALDFYDFIQEAKAFLFQKAIMSVSCITKTGGGVP